jgi:hypothetical protein
MDQHIGQLVLGPRSQVLEKVRGSARYQQEPTVDLVALCAHSDFLVSQPTGKQQNHQNDHDDSHQSTRCPAITVMPRAVSGRTDERENKKNDYQYPKQTHGFSFSVLNFAGGAPTVTATPAWADDIPEVHPSPQAMLALFASAAPANAAPRIGRLCGDAQTKPLATTALLQLHGLPACGADYSCAHVTIGV